MALFALPLMPKAAAVPLLVSLLAHAGIAAVAVQHSRPGTLISAASVKLEVSLLEAARNEPVTPELPEPLTNAVPPRVAQRPDVRAASLGPLTSQRDLAPEVAATPVASTSPIDDGPRFVMTLAPTHAGGSTLVSEGAATVVVSAGRAPIAESAAETPARLKLGRPPAYTAAALSAGVEADVPLEIVVNEAGAVISARSLAHVGYGLDEAALQSVRGYRFSPAVRDRRAVPVRMHWLMRFELR